MLIRSLIWILGIKVKSSGVVPAGHGLLVSNHRSYLDPVVVLRDCLAYPVAKAEVSTWPLIGLGARLSGVVFVKRENKTSRADARKDIIQKLASGESVLLYPEGTSHDRHTTLPFKRGVFQEIASLHIPVYPIAIDYTRSSDYFINDDTFLLHFLQMFGRWRIKVNIVYGAGIHSDDPKVLIHASKKWIDENLKKVKSKKTMFQINESGYIIILLSTFYLFFYITPLALISIQMTPPPIAP